MRWRCHSKFPVRKNILFSFNVGKKTWYKRHSLLDVTSVQWKVFYKINNAHFDPRSLLIVKKVLSIKNDLAAIKTTLRPDRSLLITLSWLWANLVHFSLKILHLVAPFLLIFLRINCYASVLLSAKTKTPDRRPNLSSLWPCLTGWGHDRIGRALAGLASGSTTGVHCAQFTVIDVSTMTSFVCSDRQIPTLYNRRIELSKSLYLVRSQ